MTIIDNFKILFSIRFYMNKWMGIQSTQQIAYEIGLLRVIVQKQTLQTQIQKKPLFR